MKLIRIILWMFSCVFFEGGCATVHKFGESTIQSPYWESNRLIEGAYTSFYNSDLRISEDLYAVYLPRAESNYLEVSQFNADQKIVQQKIGTIITSHHFVFELQGKKGEFSTRLYYLPDIRLATNTLKEARFKNKIYQLYSFSAKEGQIIQLFSLNVRSKEKRRDYSSECDAIIQKLCYSDYYKIAQSADSILIDLFASKFSEHKLKLKEELDTTLIKATHHRIISIPSNRKYTTVSFRFSPHIQNLVASGESLQLSLVDRKQFFHDPLKVISLITQDLYHSSCSLEVEVAYRDYMAIVTDVSGNLYEAVCFNVW